MPPNHQILCCPLLLLPSIFPRIRVFSNESVFMSGGQSIGASTSASVFPMNTQGWFPLGLTGLISKKSKELSRVFSSTTVQKHQFCSAQPSLWSNSHMHATAAKSLQSCPTLCDPIDGSPPVPVILQARTLEWVAISFSNAWKWKVKMKSQSRVRLLATPWTAAYQAPPSTGFSRQEYWSGVPLPSAYMTTRKTIALIIQTFFSKVMCLLFNTLSRFVIAFFQNKCLLIPCCSHHEIWSAVILEPKKRKSAPVCIFSPSVCHDVIALDAMILSWGWSQFFHPLFHPHQEAL